MLIKTKAIHLFIHILVFSPTTIYGTTTSDTVLKSLPKAMVLRRKVRTRGTLMLH